MDPHAERELIVARFAERMVARRRELGLRQQDVARAIGRHLSRVSRIETRQRDPELAEAVLIARVLDASLGELVDEAE